MNAKGRVSGALIKHLKAQPERLSHLDLVVETSETPAHPLLIIRVRVTKTCESTQRFVTQFRAAVKNPQAAQQQLNIILYQRI